VIGWAVQRGSEDTTTSRVVVIDCRVKISRLSRWREGAAEMNSNFFRSLLGAAVALVAGAGAVR
jgi:hypothetical protein